jgi:hypothetical protein
MLQGGAWRWRVAYVRRKKLRHIMYIRVLALCPWVHSTMALLVLAPKKLFHSPKKCLKFPDLRNLLKERKVLFLLNEQNLFV